MSKIHNLVGMQPDEIAALVKKASSGTVFRASKKQVTYMQLRATDLLAGLVKEYAQVLSEGGELPPGEAYLDPATGIIHLVDGVHRAEAWIAAGAESGHQADEISFPITIRLGSYQEALLHASGANAGHGQRRNRRDTEKAVRELLLDPELGRWSNGRLAKAAHVSTPYIEKIREKLEAEGVARVAKEDRIGERNGKPYLSRATTSDSSSAAMVPAPAAQEKAESSDVGNMSTDTAASMPGGMTAGTIDAIAPSLAAPTQPDPKPVECSPEAPPTSPDSGTANAATRQFAEALKAALENLPLTLRETTRQELLTELQAKSFTG
jgi:hypothetical protein